MPSSTRIPAAETGQTARSSAVVVAILRHRLPSPGDDLARDQVGQDTVPPLLAAGLRFVIAFPFCTLIARAQRAPLLFPEGQGGLFVLIVILTSALRVPVDQCRRAVREFRARCAFVQHDAGLHRDLSVLILREPIRRNPSESSGLLLTGHDPARAGVGFLPTAACSGAAAILLAALLHAYCYVTTKKRGAAIGIVTFNTLPIGIAGIALTLVGVIVEAGCRSSPRPAGARLSRHGRVGRRLLAYFHLLEATGARWCCRSCS